MKKILHITFLTSYIKENEAMKKSIFILFLLFSFIVISCGDEIDSKNCNSDDITLDNDTLSISEPRSIGWSNSSFRVMQVSLPYNSTSYQVYFKHQGYGIASMGIGLTEVIPNYMDNAGNIISTLKAEFEPNNTKTRVKRAFALDCNHTGFYLDIYLEPAP